jgi:hypothetical protein
LGADGAVVEQGFGGWAARSALLWGCDYQHAARVIAPVIAIMSRGKGAAVPVRVLGGTPLSEVERDHHEVAIP